MVTEDPDARFSYGERGDPEPPRLLTPREIRDGMTQELLQDKGMIKERIGPAPKFSDLFDVPEDKPAMRADQAVMVAIGAASMCWENPCGAGQFDPQRAMDVGNALLEYLYQKGGLKR